MGTSVGILDGCDVGCAAGAPVGRPPPAVGLGPGRAAGPADAGASVVVIKNSFCASAGASPSLSVSFATVVGGLRAAGVVGAALGSFGSPPSAGFGAAGLWTEVGERVGLRASSDVPRRRRTMGTKAMARTLIAATVAAILWREFGILYAIYYGCL